VRNLDSYTHFSKTFNLSRSNIKEANDQVTVFNSESIKTNPLVSLSREGLFFMAILCGGDYDKVSLMPTISFRFSLSYFNLRLDSKVVDGKLLVYSHRVNSQKLYF
jgi:hypothetical protein